MLCTFMDCTVKGILVCSTLLEADGFELGPVRVPRALLLWTLNMVLLLCLVSSGRGTSAPLPVELGKQLQYRAVMTCDIVKILLVLAFKKWKFMRCTCKHLLICHIPALEMPGSVCLLGIAGIGGETGDVGEVLSPAAGTITVSPLALPVTTSSSVTPLHQGGTYHHKIKCSESAHAFLALIELMRCIKLCLTPARLPKLVVGSLDQGFS